ncbi:AAA family ATPase [Chloroflexia bacterium SDU3-3]|nr:AAA family ATPase [Chloroflexia bacterium SDU3-3]
MALRPSQHYQDELDQAIDKKIDQALERWPAKLWRIFQRLAIIGVSVALYWFYLAPVVTGWVTQGNPVLDVLMFAMRMALTIALSIVQFVAIFWFMGRGRVYWVKPGETGISFKDYRGNPEVVEAAQRIVTLLKGVKEFKDMGGEVTRGLLLIGPPGTGKSYLAQAISTEAGVPFGYASAPSFQNMFVGVGPLRVRMLYSKARKLAKTYGACILFIDEIDAIGTARGGGTGGPMGAMGGMFGGGMGLGIINELLLQMDPPPQEVRWWKKALRTIGLLRKKVEMPPVLTIGATNLAETLDAALLRPGRFDRKIVVDKPDADGRREILEYYLSKVKHDPMPMERMVSDTIGYTPVALKYVINEAVIHAHFDSRQSISYWDFSHAREVHEWGLRQPIRNMSYEDRRRIAYHEAGHAYAMVKLYKKEKFRLTKVTIIRHGGALGLAAPKPVEETYTSTKEEELTNIQISLASRAAEEIFLGVQMTGVTGDLQSATVSAALIVGAYGMDSSFISYLPMGFSGMLQATMSNPELKARMDRILNEQYARVKALIEQNKEAVSAIAEALILRNELTDIDVAEILARVEAERPFSLTPEGERRHFGFGTQLLPEPAAPRRHYPSDRPHIPVPSAQQPSAER